MIREAVIDDVPRVVALAPGMHRESNYQSVPLHMARVAKFTTWLIEGEIGTVFVSEHDDVIDGVLMAMLAPAWFANGVDTIAEELVLYVASHARHSGAARGLALAFKQWAEQHGAKQARAGTSAGAAGQAAGTIYEGLGFELTGHCYLFDFAGNAQRLSA